MKPQYEPKTLPQILGYLAEECGEVVAAVGKTIRWGLESVNPELPREEQETNRDWILREVADLEGAIRRFREYVGEYSDGTAIATVAPVERAGEAAGDKPTASSACPVCGDDNPHSHDRFELDRWLSNMVARWGVSARTVPLPSLCAFCSHVHGEEPCKWAHRDSGYEWLCGCTRGGPRVASACEPVGNGHFYEATFAENRELAKHGLPQTLEGILELRSRAVPQAEPAPHPSRRGRPYHAAWCDDCASAAYIWADTRTCRQCGSARTRTADPRENAMRHAWETSEGMLTDESVVPQASAVSAWTSADYENHDRLPQEFSLVAVERDGGAVRIVTTARWEPERGCWLDVASDGQNDPIEWWPGEVTHWRPAPVGPWTEPRGTT